MAVTICTKMPRSRRNGEMSFYSVDHCRNFIILLSANSLDGWEEPEDYFRLASLRALEMNKNIILVEVPGFSWPDSISTDLASLKRCQRLQISSLEDINALYIWLVRRERHLFLAPEYRMSCAKQTKRIVSCGKMTEEDVVSSGGRRKRISYMPLFPTPNVFTEMRSALTLITKTIADLSGTFSSNLFGKTARKGCPDEEAGLQEVYGSVFAPSEIKRGSHLLVQVFLHLLEDSEKINDLAQEPSPRTERRDYIPLLCKLKVGTEVCVQLSVYGDTLLKKEEKLLVWQGRFTKCSFDCLVPKSCQEEDLSCQVLLCVDGRPIGEMRFITSIVERPRPLYPEGKTRIFEKIFISYAHEDASKVSFMARAYHAQGVDYFFDRHYLKPGSIFPEEIRSYIEKADLFILCWSANAEKSDYVKCERLFALKHAYPNVPVSSSTLTIYPMSIEPRAELPEDMKDIYNFVEEL